MDNFDLKKYLAEGRINLNEVEGDKEEGGTYRVYMNSDMDEPKRIDYERYFGDGTKEEMVQQAKKMAYSNDPTNQYGDPILVVVTHEDDIDDVAWSSEDIHDELNSLVDEFEDIDESVNEAAIPKLEKELEKVILKYMKDDEHTIPNIAQTVKLFPFSKFAKYYKTKKAAGLAEPQVEGKLNENIFGKYATRKAPKDTADENNPDYDLYMGNDDPEYRKFYMALKRLIEKSNKNLDKNFEILGWIENLLNHIKPEK